MDNFAQSELEMVQFAQRRVLLAFLLCFSLFSFIVCWPAKVGKRKLRFAARKMKPFALAY